MFDIHAHFDPPEENFSDFGSAQDAIAKDYSKRVAYMDRNGIEQAALSAGFIYGRTEGIVSTRKVNDLVAACVAKHSDRFPAGLGTVQLSDGDASLRELERMAKDLRFRGVIWHHGACGFPINHPFMRPLLRQVQELKLIPFIHGRQKESESLWRLEAVAEEFPGMTFVALDTFTSAEDREHRVRILRRRNNILCDTESCVYGGRTFHRVFRQEFRSGTAVARNRWGSRPEPAGRAERSTFTGGKADGSFRECKEITESIKTVLVNKMWRANSNSVYGPDDGRYARPDSRAADAAHEPYSTARFYGSPPRYHRNLAARTPPRRTIQT